MRSRKTQYPVGEVRVHDRRVTLARRSVVASLMLLLFAGRAVLAADVFPGAAWEIATPASQGLDAAKLEEAVAWPEAPRRTFAAMGHNNNVLFVVPEWKLVIARLGLDGADQRIGDAEWSQFLGQVGRALPASPEKASIGATLGPTSEPRLSAAALPGRLRPRQISDR